MQPLYMRVLFSIIGLAYVLPSELSFSLWFFYFFFLLQAVAANAMGIPMRGVQAYGTKELVAHQMWGGILAAAVISLIAARPHLVRLRDATSETANLIILDGDHAIYVDQVESPYALRHSGWVGRRVPLAGTATGTAFGDRTTSHVAKDAVETGVTAIVCAIDLPGDEAAVGVTAPNWRIEEFGVMRAQRMVEAVAREIAQRLHG